MISNVFAMCLPELRGARDSGGITQVILSGRDHCLSLNSFPAHFRYRFGPDVGAPSVVTVSLEIQAGTKNTQEVMRFCGRNMNYNHTAYSID